MVLLMHDVRAHIQGVVKHFKASKAPKVLFNVFAMIGVNCVSSELQLRNPVVKTCPRAAAIIGCHNINRNAGIETFRIHEFKKVFVRGDQDEILNVDN